MLEAGLKPLPDNLPITSVPDEVVDEAAQPAPRLTPGGVLAEVRRLGLETPAEAPAIVRADGSRTLGASGWIEHGNPPGEGDGLPEFPESVT